MSSVNVLVVFYSTYGHIYKLAQAVAEGASSVEGVTVRLARFPETLSDEILTKMHALEAKKQWADVPEVTHDDFKWADAIVFGSPTRFGNVAGQVKSYIDSLGGLWASNALVGKLASAFTSSNTQHGGQETTIVCGFLPLFLHLGMLVVGLPYTFAGQFPVDEVSGGSPYGASVVAGVWGARQPSENELNAGRFQGKHVATQAVRLGKVPVPEADKSN